MRRHRAAPVFDSTGMTLLRWLEDVKRAKEDDLVMIVLQELTDVEGAVEAEKRWILKLKEEGHSLLNSYLI